MRNSFLAVTVALAALVAGCGTGGTSTALRPVDAGAQPDLVIKHAVETRASLTSLSGKGVMRIVDTPNKFGLKVNAEVLADESDRLRIRGDKLAGAVQAFDVVMLGNDIGFYVPTQKVLYHGTVAELDNMAFRFQPDEILRQLLRPDNSLLLKEWQPRQPSATDPKNSLAFESVPVRGQPRYNLTIDKKNGMVTSIAQLDARGDPVFVKTYGDYRPISRGRQLPKGVSEPVFPYLMTLSWPRDRRLMEMHFKSVEGDPVVLEEDFDLAASDDVRYMPLRDVRIDADETDPVADAGRVNQAERPL